MKKHALILANANYSDKKYFLVADVLEGNYDKNKLPFDTKMIIDSMIDKFPI